MELFRDIEDRWNRGCFGREYEDCDDYATQQRWNTGAGKGREKIFEVRRIHNDLTFVDEFLTLDFCRRYKLFSFGYNNDSGYYEIESRQFEQVKQRLLFGLTNLGRPIIRVREGNYKNRGELYLEHEFSARAANELCSRHAHEPAPALETSGAYRDRIGRPRDNAQLRRRASRNQPTASHPREPGSGGSMSAHPLIEMIRQCSCSPNAPASVQHDNGTFLAIAEVAQTDRLAAELRSLRFSIPATVSWSLPELKQLAKALAERVQYLLEPLALIEVDPEAATVQFTIGNPGASRERPRVLRSARQTRDAARLPLCHAAQRGPRTHVHASDA